MARILFATTNNSDLSGGADFNRKLEYNIIGASTALSVSIAQGATETSYCFTEPLHPGTGGNVTGNYTVSLNCTTANANIAATCTLNRINSTGTVQTSSTASGSVSFGTTGAKTFTFTSLSLGTFSSTDRLRVDFSFTNSAAHSANAVGITFNSVDSSIITPHTVRKFLTT